MRTCAGCRRRFDVGALMRIGIGVDGDLVIGPTARGRGVWLCRSSTECFARARQSFAFGRGLRVAVSVEAVELLERALAGGEIDRSIEGTPGTVAL